MGDSRRLSAMSDNPATAPVILAHEPAFALGALAVRPDTREVAGPGLSEILEPRVMQVLVALHRADGQVVTRDELTASCWDGRVVGDDAINRVISRIRRLADHPGAAFKIETITKVGYRLRRESGPTSEPAGAALVVVQPPRRRLGWRSLLAALALCALAIALAVWQPWRAAATMPPGAAADYEAARATMLSHTAADAARAVALLQDVVAAAPQSAEAWAALALAYYALVEFTSPDAQAGLDERALAAARHALELDPQQPEAHVVRALLTPVLFQWAEADRIQSEALAYAPAQRDLLVMRGYFFAGSGRIHAALDYLGRANALDPPTARNVAQYASVLSYDGQLELADRLLDDGARQWPRSGSIFFPRFWINLYSGRADKALAIIDDVNGRPIGIPAEDFELCREAAVAITTRSPQKIARVLEAQKAAAWRGRGYAQNAIGVAATLGDLDLAFAIADALYLNRGAVIPRTLFSGTQGQYGRESALPVFILFTPAAQAMRRDPRFVPLVEALGLGDHWRQSGDWPDFCTADPAAAQVCGRIKAGK